MELYRNRHRADWNAYVRDLRLNELLAKAFKGLSAEIRRLDKAIARKLGKA